MKSALFVIDYINGIVNGSCHDYVTKHPIIDNTNKLIASCRAISVPIYFIRLAFDADYTDIPKHSKGFNNIKQQGLFQLGSNSCEFIEDLDIQHDDVIVDKTAASPFHSKDLINLLISKNIEKLIFTGLATDNAINIGVREANDAGYFTVIAEDACGASSEEFHNWSIKMLEKIANEIDSTDVIIANITKSH